MRRGKARATHRAPKINHKTREESPTLEPVRICSVDERNSDYVHVEHPQGFDLRCVHKGSLVAINDD